MTENSRNQSEQPDSDNDAVLPQQQNWTREAEPDEGVAAIDVSIDTQSTADGANVASPAQSLTPPEQESPPPPERIVEAMLFTGGEPLTAAMAIEILPGLTTDDFGAILDRLNQQYTRQGRPYRIEKRSEGFIMALRSRFRKVRERLYGSQREVQLSQAAIDVLALVAYRQPAAKQEIDTLRGVESGSIVRQLVRRGLIAAVPRGDEQRRELAYVTTQRFLDFFGLSSLDDLPRTQDLQQI